MLIHGKNELKNRVYWPQLPLSLPGNNSPVQKSWTQSETYLVKREVLRKQCFHFQIFLLSLVSLAFAQDVEIQQDVIAEVVPDQIINADNQVWTFYQIVQILNLWHLP